VRLGPESFSGTSSMLGRQDNDLERTLDNDGPFTPPGSKPAEEPGLGREMTEYALASEILGRLICDITDLFDRFPNQPGVHFESLRAFEQGSRPFLWDGLMS